VQKETGENRTAPGPRKSKDDAHQHQQAYQRPVLAKLRSVHEAKKNARHQDARSHSGPDSKGKLHPKEVGHRRNSPRNYGVQVSAKDGFLRQRRHEHRHGHQEHRSVAALEKFLNRRVLRFLDPRAGDRDEQREPAAGEEIHPRFPFACDGIGFQFFPAESAPKRQVPKHGKSHVEEKKDEGKRERAGANKEFRIRLEKLLALYLREMPVNGIIAKDNRAADTLGDNDDKTNNY